MDEDSYRDEQLVELYDSDNAACDDHEYYRTLADTVEAIKILDFGCGTGLLTRALATPGRVVIGVDPSATMLSYARRQPGAETVTWIDGDATADSLARWPRSGLPGSSRAGAATAALPAAPTGGR